jgi:hypothetical protein
MEAEAYEARRDDHDSIGHISGTPGGSIGGRSDDAS